MHQQCTIYAASPTLNLKCERTSDAERNMDLIETVRQYHRELIQWRNVKKWKIDK
jgi:hypothetical protein